MTTAPPDPASIATVEDLTPLIVAADEMRRAIIATADSAASWSAMAEACDALAAIYSRAMTLAATSHPKLVYFASRDASQHWMTQAAVMRQRARQAEERGW